MGDVMLFGILRMPYHLAMNNDTACIQYWQAGQRAADEIERLQKIIRGLLLVVDGDVTSLVKAEQLTDEARSALPSESL